ncbi:MAG: hypothetical protein GF333_08175 [Candidatus Omnitrophica bacterium]|nr:hypothetical protein [Candidatus Omnitrophota bacterium]
MVQVRRAAAYACVVLCLVAVPVRAGVQDALRAYGISSREFERTLNFFYIDRDYDRLMQITEALVNQEEFVRDTPHVMPFIHFVAVAARQNHDFLQRLRRFSENSTGVSREVVREIVYQTENFRSPEPDTPYHLDFLWAEFTASGDLAPVGKIISVLDYVPPPKGQKVSDARVNEALLFYSARWSLAAHARQHGKVYDLLRRRARGHGRVAEVLSRLLQELPSGR